MAFTQPERERFIAALESRAWLLRDGSIRSPSGGLWFDDSHFEHWCPEQMREVFTARVARMESDALDDWQAAVEENRQVCSAASAAEGA